LRRRTAFGGRGIAPESWAGAVIFDNRKLRDLAELSAKRVREAAAPAHYEESIRREASLD
jgi:hypothetical protein